MDLASRANSCPTGKPFTLLRHVVREGFCLGAMHQGLGTCGFMRLVLGLGPGGLACESGRFIYGALRNQLEARLWQFAVQMYDLVVF